jgi:hypothetical protein
MQQQPLEVEVQRLESSFVLLSERATTAVRSAIQGQLRQPSADHSLRRALRALCVEARARDLRAEHLILLFKRVWHSLPESRGQETRKKHELLDRLITICVEEYYAK